MTLANDTVNDMWREMFQVISERTAKLSALNKNLFSENHHMFYVFTCLIITFPNMHAEIDVHKYIFCIVLYLCIWFWIAEIILDSPVKHINNHDHASTNTTL